MSAGILGFLIGFMSGGMISLLVCSCLFVSKDDKD